MKKVTQPAPPCPSEYEFSTIISDDLTAACWWEYLRESKRVHMAVTEYRLGKLSLSPKVEPVRDIIGISLGLALSLHTDFPARPWIGLDEESRKYAKAIINDSLTPAVWIRPDGYHATRGEITEALGGFNVRLPFLGGSVGARGSARRSLLVTINWEASDEQIAEAVSEWLRENRPRSKTTGKRRPRLTGGNKAFRAQYLDALNWLRPHRLHQYLGTWDKVARALDRQNPRPDAQKEMAGKARKIIRWLDGS